jgi:hypothetical protein
MTMKTKAFAATAAFGLACFLPSAPAHAADVFPSQDACHAVNNSAPAGNCGPFTLAMKENFNAVQVPAGVFSGCVDGSFACAGLKSKYPAYYAELGAYPTGWPDTAGNGADGNSGPVPGEYHPERAVSVVKVGTDGQMRVHLTSTGALNSVAAVVPRKCTFRYGKFTERTRVSSLARRFKMAHLHYAPEEIDYPEAGESFGKDPVSEFTHGFSESGADAAPNASWTTWHTYSQEVVPGHVRFYIDGRLFKTVNADYPKTTEWVLQNESALGVSKSYVSGAPTSVDIDTSWIWCGKYTG